MSIGQIQLVVQVRTFLKSCKGGVKNYVVATTALILDKCDDIDILASAVRHIFLKLIDTLVKISHFNLRIIVHNGKNLST
jgi:hypothetical protein